MKVRVKRAHTRVMPEGGYFKYAAGEVIEIPKEWFNKNLHERIAEKKKKKKPAKKQE